MAADQFTVKGSLLFDTSFFDKGVKKATASLKSFGSQATRIGRDVSTYLGLPLVAAATAALKTASAFEFAQKKVSALRGGANISKLTKSARDLGATTIFTATQVSELQLSLAKLGKSNNDIQAIQKTVLQFAQAMDMELAPAGEFIVKTMNRFSESLKKVGGEQEQATYIANLFATAAANTALTSESLAASLNYVGSEAAVFGLSIGETTAILGLLADRGFDASRGGTALRRILGQLAKDGFTAEQAIGQLFDETKGFSQELQQFGLRGAGPAASLGNLREEFEALKKEIEESDGFLQGFATTLDTSITASFKRVSSAFNELSISFAESFIKPINVATDNISKFVRGLAEMDDSSKESIVTSGAFVVAFGAITTVIGVVVAAIAALVAAVGSVAAVATILIAAIGTMLGVTSLLKEDFDAASYSLDELRRKLLQANKGFEDISTSEFVKEEELRRLTQYELTIGKITKHLEIQKLKPLYGKAAEYVKRVERELQDTKDAQKAYSDELRRSVALRKEEAKLYGTNPILNPLNFVAKKASGGEKKEEIDNAETLADLLKERLDLLKKIDTLRKQAKSNGKTGVFDVESLTQAKEQLSQIETLLKLAGIDLAKDKNKKPIALEVPKGLLDAFEVANLGTEFFKSGEMVAMPLAFIEGNARRASEALRVLKDLQIQNNAAISEQVVTDGKASQSVKLKAKEYAALITYYETLLDLEGNNLPTFEPAYSKGFVELMSEDIDDLIDKNNELKDEFKQAALELKSFILAITTALSNVVVTAFRDSIEGTKKFGESLKENLVNALQKVLAKVLALIAAFIVLNILSGGMFAGTGVGAMATSALDGQNMGQFISSGFTGGRSSNGGEGVLRVEGVLTGSDLSISTKRGVTSNERVYG